MSSLPVLRETADEVRLFDPATGEELDLATAATDQLAYMLAYIRNLEEDLKLAKQTLGTEFTERCDREARWSWAGNGYTLKVPSPAPSVEYNAEQLRVRLNALAAQGVISFDAVHEAVEKVVTYKPRVAGINRLRKLGGAVASAIDETATQVEKARRVTLGRAA
jgi:hypothetical protein